MRELLPPATTKPREGVGHRGSSAAGRVIASQSRARGAASLARILLPLRIVAVKGGVLSKVLRGVVAGWGAKKSGCGCIGTIVIFFILWSLLGSFKLFQ